MASGVAAASLGARQATCLPSSASAYRPATGPTNYHDRGPGGCRTAQGTSQDAIRAVFGQASPCRRESCVGVRGCHATALRGADGATQGRERDSMERSGSQKICLRYPLPETSSGRAVPTRACAAQQVREVVESVAEYRRRWVRAGRERGRAVDVADESGCFLRPHAHKEPEGRQVVGGRRRVRREGVWVGRSGGPESGRERPRDAESQSPKDARQTMPTEGAGLCSGWRGGGVGLSKKQSTRVSGRAGEGEQRKTCGRL